MPFNRSAPYYVLVTTDWDFADPGQPGKYVSGPPARRSPGAANDALRGPVHVHRSRRSPTRARRARRLAAASSATRSTTRSACTSTRTATSSTAAGLTCVTDQSTVYAMDTTGYTIKLGAYDRAAVRRAARARGHAVRRSTASPRRTDVPRRRLDGDARRRSQALADKGFTADTSALNWARHRGVGGPRSCIAGTWRTGTRSATPASRTTRAMTNVLTSTAPTLPILEVPDNGVMIDYVTLPEMNGLFDANWNGEPLDRPAHADDGLPPGDAGFSRGRVSARRRLPRTTPISTSRLASSARSSTSRSKTSSPHTRSDAR